jgi:hypothetical protein
MSLPFRKLGLGGGGAKGILHIGALRELAKHQKLFFPDGVYGCSIGSIIATFVAFEIPFDDEFLELSKHFFSLEQFVPELKFENILKGFSAKGLFTMDVFCKKLTEVFKLKNLDIETLKIKDAKMPLYIVASNITKGIPTIFTGDILLIDAIRCSCCLPIVYRPQELYGQLYIDGDAFLPYIGSLHKDALVLSLKTHWDKITLDTYENMPILTYIRVVYNLGVMNVIELHKNDLTIGLTYPKLVVDSNLEDFDLQDIFKVSGELIRSFLITKGFLKELPEIVDGRST